MKILRVKIIGVSKSGYWYKDLIGKEVHVVEDFVPENHPFWYVVIPEGTHDHHPIKQRISVGDFEILEEYDGEVVERIVISIDRYRISDKKSMSRRI